MRNFRNIILISFFLVTAFEASAQRKREKNKITPETGPAKKEAALDVKQAEYNKSKDHHLKAQDKATRKRMKQTKKKAERHSWGKDVPWYKRWFRKDKF